MAPDVQVCGMDEPQLSDPLPGLAAEAVRRLAGSWSDAGFWADIEWLAARFWTTVGVEHAIAWHHLVLAIGNFKRQPGRRLHAGRLAGLQPAPAVESRRSAIEVPGADPVVRVSVENFDSWRSLSGALPGAAEATTTTLLAALWPDRHFVFDWRVFAAANALRISAGLVTTPDIPIEGSEMPQLTFDDYRIVREWVIGVAALTLESPSAVERSLYRLSQLVPAADGRTWARYADEISAKLAAVAEE